MSNLSGKTTIMVGASRGLGHGIAIAFAHAGARVVVISSGAALNANGSPVSGGYAGAKATQRLIPGYAQDEAARAGLGISFATVLPQFAPLTGVGRPAVQAYAGRAGLSVEDFLRAQPFPMLSPEIAGTALVE